MEPEDTREIIDIVELNVDIKNIVTRANNLRNEINSIILEIEGGSHE